MRGPPPIFTAYLYISIYLYIDISIYIFIPNASKILDIRSQMSVHILLLAIRHPICLSKCVRNYHQFQKHALAPTLGALALFTLGKYRNQTWLCKEANLAAGGE